MFDPSSKIPLLLTIGVFKRSLPYVEKANLKDVGVVDVEHVALVRNIVLGQMF